MLDYLLFVFVLYTFIGLMCGMVAYTVSNVLLYEDVLNWYAKLLNRLPKWLGKPLGLCSKCFAGQLALWFSVYFISLPSFDLKDLLILPYPICVAIYLTTKL